MEMSSRRTTRMALVVMLLVAGAASIDGVRTWRQQRWNALIAAAQVPAEAKDVPAQVVFATRRACRDGLVVTRSP